ncbi:unnamed protein product [Nyctereutes procyonoides]|uniref:(raccoon dog) hypothetical protein n=1 Tax=Nyctereutes procyonoides TaxID=34880 RepID=A0A811ZS79_NYCPR|nr:unnamed protein product [Nyctereutes procyonoides]
MPGRLRILYTKILNVLEQIPKNALSMAKAEPDVKLEDQLRGGQLEEVILQWKSWELSVEEPPAHQWKWPT